VNARINNPAEVEALLSSREVCRRYGIPIYRLEYLLRTDQLAAPPMLAGRRVFGADDCMRLEKLLAQD